MTPVHAEEALARLQPGRYRVVEQGCGQLVLEPACQHFGW